MNNSKKIYKRLFLILIVSIGLSSCAFTDFGDINTDPNNPEKVEPDFLFATSVSESLNLYGGHMNRVIFFNYTHQYSGFQGSWQRYNYSDSENNSYWRSAYVYCMQPVNKIVENFKDNDAYHNRVLIARIWKAYIISQTVAFYGPIPASKALNGEPNIPYDSEESIHDFLFQELKECAEGLDSKGDRYQKEYDFVYQGDIDKWKKFSNSLRLRLALRIKNADPAKAATEAQAVLNDENATITRESESATAHWGTTSTTWSPLYDRVVYNEKANLATLPVLCESMVYHTRPYNDPRLTVYAQPATQGPFKGEYFGQNISYGGQPNGFPVEENPHRGLTQKDYSAIGSRFLQPDAEWVFISYAEVALLKAEAALYGWKTTKSSEQYYYEGIDASFAKYDLSAYVDAYKNTPGIKWGTASDIAGREKEFQDFAHICTSAIEEGDYFRQIVMQHWLAIPMQCGDAWELLRRTQVLEFQPMFASYEGTILYMPSRLPYPSDEYQANNTEVLKAVATLGEGGDYLFTTLSWGLPPVKNENLPNE